MNKQEKTTFGIGHFSDLSIQPENFRSIYQLQFAANLDNAVVEGPLFLNLSGNQTEDLNRRGKDILYES